MWIRHAAYTSTTVHPSLTSALEVHKHSPLTVAHERWNRESMYRHTKRVKNLVESWTNTVASVFIARMTNIAMILENLDM